MNPYDHIYEARKESFNRTGQYLSDEEIFYSSTNNGGDTDYYSVPPNTTTLQDLIEHKDMSWNVANIFKACYRLKDQSHSDELRDINKILWFANRQKNILLNKDPK